jgi:hypothetical protein
MHKEVHMTKSKQSQENYRIKEDAVARDHEINKIQMTIRSASRILNSVKTMEGEGLVVNRSLPNNKEFDPFLLLDEFGPLELAPGQIGGVPAHPHRGFETVTYMLDGRFEHKDSQGRSGQTEHRRRSMDDCRRRRSTLRNARKRVRA